MSNGSSLIEYKWEIGDGFYIYYYTDGQLWYVQDPDNKSLNTFLSIDDAQFFIIEAYER